MNPCGKLTQYAVPWAGKIIITCEDHANQFITLAGAIGSPMQVRRIESTEEQQCNMPKIEEEPA
jgi:hypothetical protein